MGRKIAIAAALVALVSLSTAPAAGAMNLSRLMAPVSVCANQGDLDAPAAVQEQAMHCMTNFARRHVRRAGLGDAAQLDRSAFDKSRDILRCDSFSHYACGRDFTYWMQRVGYIPARCWRAAENIAWGEDDYGTVRSIFRSWMHSPGHRENILGSFSQIGIGLRVGTLDGRRKVHVWTQHFGSHCGRSPAHPSAPLRAHLANASAVGP